MHDSRIKIAMSAYANLLNYIKVELITCKQILKKPQYKDVLLHRITEVYKLADKKGGHIPEMKELANSIDKAFKMIYNKNSSDNQKEEALGASILLASTMEREELHNSYERNRAFEKQLQNIYASRGSGGRRKRTHRKRTHRKRTHRK